MTPVSLLGVIVIPAMKPRSNTFCSTMVPWAST